MNTNCPHCKRPMDRHRGSYHNHEANQRYIYFYSCDYDDCIGYGQTEFTEDELRLTTIEQAVREYMLAVKHGSLTGLIEAEKHLSALLDGISHG